MGAGVAMKAALFLGAALGLLGACSSDSPGLTGAQGFGQALQGMVARVGSGSAGTEAIAFDLTPQMIAETGGNVIMVRITSKGITAPMVLSGRNADVMTFSGGGVVSISMRDGVILATRGLGDDLMTARVPTLRQLTSGARSYQRSYELFNGVVQPQEEVASCNVAPAGPAQISVSGKSIASRIVDETCIISAGRIDNRYWLNAAGRVVRSQQWISPTVGFVEVLAPG